MAESSSSSNAAASRRGAPSPLVFNSETVLPVSSSTNVPSRTQTVNMPHVKKNITRRLKLAKQECDAALYRIINSITQFIEEQIRNKQAEETQHQLLKESFDISISDIIPRQDRGLFDTASDDAGYDAEAEGRHSRQRSISSSPSLRRSVHLPATTQFQQSTESSPRKLSGGSNVWPTQSGSYSSRRLSRSIHVPLHSSSSSRSTSRSRSPLPSQPAPGLTPSPSIQPLEPPVSIVSPCPRNPDTLSQSAHSNRRHSRVFLDEPPAPDPFLSSLNELTTVATDICETSVSTLTAHPKLCHELVAKVRTIGHAWDEHPDWPGRSWHMQILLALASLTRVVEWWEAENKFWNFTEEGDFTETKDGEDEPLLFVLKPEPDEHDTMKPTSPFALDHQPSKEQDPKALMVRDEYRTRFSPSKPSSISGRQSRDEPTRVHTPSKQQDSIISLGPQTEAPQLQTAETLREVADFARYTTIVLELAADGDHVVSINLAWRIVVGSDPDDLLRNGLSRYLHPDNWNTFKEACRDLQTDKGNTKEVRFKLLVEPDDDDDDEKGEDLSPIYYCDMEGKGMLVSNKSASSHTIWVLKTLSPPREEYPNVRSTGVQSGEGGGEPTPAELLRSFDAHRATDLEPITPFPLQHPISTALILCRICECQVPEWYFEKHNESCNDVHRFEADIADCNETIAELRSTVRDLSAALERLNTSSVVPEYRGMQIFTPGSSPNTGSLLSQTRTHLSRMQRANVKKMQQRILDQLEDILSMASEISTPALREEENMEPVECQLLLSPGSVAKVESIRQWNKPVTEDPALSKLIQDVEKVMFAKVDNVLRMRERIRYSELNRKVWEASVEEQLAKEEDSGTEGEAEMTGNGGNEHGSGNTDRVRDKLFRLVGEHHSVGSQSSKSPSEYSVGREPEPTPLAASSPIMNPVAVREPMPYPGFQTFGGAFGTRSSTPSSISSPLALAVPITAPPPSLTLSPEHDPSRIIRTRRSTQALSIEPRLTITPPLSPMVTGSDSKPGGAHLRRHSTVHAMSPITSSGPLSPRLSASAPLPRITPPSLKDFEIIKPISKGAFGSVFLAKKKVTGDYYAIKVLRKADMIAKNQITNVKHERMILMKQSESPFVTKLYFTFQSKDYLYLVMEYLNGGDCAALIKSLGSLPEEWTRNYVAEVVLGLEYLHKRGIVHRDLKPDNLLIDQHGHLKLTDFGLSRIGLLNRQARDANFNPERLKSRSFARYSPSRPPSIDSASPFTSQLPIVPDSYFNVRSNSHSSPHPVLGGDDVSESSGSESLSGLFWKRGRPGESPLQSFATDLTTDLRSHSGISTPPTDQKFVGTPDYLAPESILGISGDDPTVDWWALGVITYEFLYGIPPFHAETPEKVFENILSGHIEWHDDWVEFSDEARDFMMKLLVTDPAARLGANGAEEVKAHPFFAGVEWDKVTTQEAQFIPQVTDPESTDYFDPRGAVPQFIQDDDGRPAKPVLSESPASDYLATPPIPVSSSRDPSNSPVLDDFGAFSYKNLPVLKQANDDVIRKLKTEAKPELRSAPGILGLDAPAVVGRSRSVSQRQRKPPSVITSGEKVVVSQGGPPSPSTSASSMASSPAATHVRRPSEYTAVERFKASQLEEVRRNSMPSRLRTASVSSADQASSAGSSDLWQRLPGRSDTTTTSQSMGGVDKKTLDHASGDRILTCLIVEDNPISQKILETVLTRMGCRCILAADGAEAISIALADIKLDCIFMDLYMPMVDGEEAARYIKSTNNKNTSTPIVAVSAYSGQDASGASNIFAASLAKPISKHDLVAAIRQLGFKMTTNDGSKTSMKIGR